MRQYSTHFHPAGSRQAGSAPVLVKEGFSWRCLIVGWLGLLRRGSWIVALLAGAATFALRALTREFEGGWPVLVGGQVLLACFANDLRRWELGLRGFALGPLVCGRTPDAALLRLLDRRPELVGGGA